MPGLSIWYVRTALVYLALGMTLGMLMLLHKGVPIHPAMWALLPAHIEFLLSGWTLQLAFGVAFWILPRFQTARGNVRLAWLAYALLNTGIWMVTLSPWLGNLTGLAWAGRAAEALAVAAFALHAWPRIKPAGA